MKFIIPFPPNPTFSRLINTGRVAWPADPISVNITSTRNTEDMLGITWSKEMEGEGSVQERFLHYYQLLCLLYIQYTVQYLHY